MNFKKGDRVRVKILKNKPSYWNKNGQMDHMMGKEYTIAGLYYSGYEIYDKKYKRFFVFGDECLEPVKNDCIVIYRKGSETIALNKATGEKAVAICSPDDTYNFETGARLAFDRLVKPPVKEVKRIAQAGEYVKIVDASHNVPITNGKPDYKVGDILKITDVYFSFARYADGVASNGLERILTLNEYVVLENYQPPKEEKPAFKPYLQHKNNGHYGNMGDETPFKDAIGRALRIGDTVELYDRYNNYIGEKPIVMGCFGEPIVMGIGINCSKDGTIEYFKIILKRRYEEVDNGEYVDNVKYIKEEV